MYDSARRRHPLHITGTKVTSIAKMIFMAHVAVQHVRDGFKATMGMRGKASKVVVRIVGVEFIEHQERVHVQAPLTA